MERRRFTELPTNMKTIGVLGGMGPQATMDFEQRVHSLSQQYLPQKASTGYPPMIVGYFREVPIGVNKDGSLIDPVQPNPHLMNLAQQIGAISDFLVITSNTPHFFAEEIEQKSGKKVLSMVTVTIDEVKRRGLATVGVTAVGITSRNRLYQAPLNALGIAAKNLPTNLAEELDDAIFSVMEGRETDQSRTVARKAIDYLRQQGADGIILGCTELPLLLGEQVNGKDIINPSALLAEAAVKYALTTTTGV